MRSRSALADGGQRLAGGPPRIRGRAGREGKPDTEAAREGPRGLRRAAVRRGDLGRDGQAEAGAPGSLASGPVEALEDVRQLARRDAGAIVADLDGDTAADVCRGDCSYG